MKRSSMVVGTSFLLAAAGILATNGAVSPPAQASSIHSASSNSSTVTTVPDAHLPTTSLNPAIAEYARQKNISLDEGVRRLQIQDRLTAFADTLRSSDPDFSSFAIDDSATEPVGLLARTNETEISLPSTLNVRMSHARLTETQSRDLTSRISKRLAGNPIELTVNKATVRFVGVTYDGLSDSFVAHYSSDPDAPNSAALEAKADQVFKGVLLETGLIESVPSSEKLTSVIERPTAMTFGGKRVTFNSPIFWWSTATSKCTSGFGIYLNGVGGYMTAGHCGNITSNGSNTVNGNSIGGVSYAAGGGYVDREVLLANGASWYVYNGAYNEDMAATPTHIYQGTYYCEYGSVTNTQACGSVQAVNQGVTGPFWGTTITVYTSMGSSNQYCQGGDSGGPVWQPRPYQESLPAGTVEAAPIGGGTCQFLALDDQLAGSGLLLL